MKVLVVSHAYVERDNHKKLEALSLVANIDIAVIYPRVWQTWHGENKIGREPSGPTNYKEFTLNAFFSGNGGKYFFNPFELIKVIIRVDPDLVHLEEEPFTLVAFQVVLLASLLGKKVVFFSWENLNFSVGWVRTFFEKLVFTFSKSAVAGNQGSLNRLQVRGFKHQIVIIPQFGVDTQVFKRTRQNRSEDGLFLVGFVGRPSMAKGIDTLFKALSLAGPKFNLLIVTSSPKIPREIISLAKSTGIWERTRFEVSIPHDKLPDFYNSMDVFVLPSRTTKTWVEQFGRTMIEAMSCGVPVIGSNSGAIPEVLGKSGLVFPEGDAGALASCLLSLDRDDSSRQRLIHEGLRRVKNDYSFEQIARKTADFYLSL